MLISGWFESEYGAEQVCFSNVNTVEDLAGMMYSRYGADCVGVDLELDGEFVSGGEVVDFWDELLNELEYLMGKATP